MQGSGGESEGVADSRWAMSVMQELNHLPPDPRQAMVRVAELDRQWRSSLAERLTAPINKVMQAAPVHSYDDKRTLVSDMAALLKSTGLAFRCPITGRPARLIADYAFNEHVESRFRLEVTLANGQRRRTYTGPMPPKLDLMVMPPSSGIDQKEKRQR